jgi:hypothetical protein
MRNASRSSPDKDEQPQGTRQPIVSAVLFENQEGFVFDHLVFLDDKPSYCSFANQTQTLAAEEVLAKFAPPSE